MATKTQERVHKKNFQTGLLVNIRLEWVRLVIFPQVGNNLSSSTNEQLFQRGKEDFKEFNLVERPTPKNAQKL